MQDLERWKQSPRRRPLLLEGARQVGKTWLANEFGRMHYDNVAYVSFFSITQSCRRCSPEISPLIV
ncbi:AAA family ATPase [Bifidobacterium hapali]|uniref:AAA family ATPase n=1 Tax=Bifidobacterium hapali TaxID=1630172 RepID=UPI003B82D464